MMRRLSIFIGSLAFICSASMTSGCKPEESPLKSENESLRKQVAKQESVIVSLQEGNKVMQQQIDLLNRELRDAKKESERAETDRKALAERLEAQSAENRKLSTEAHRLAARKAQVAQSLRVEDTGGQMQELSQALAVVCKAAEDVLVRSGYTLKASMKTEQNAVYVTERKVSTPASLELPGFRNQYLLSLHTLPSHRTRLSVKAEFEKMAQGGRILAAGPEEIAEIEHRLITEIAKALTPSGKT